MNTVSMMSMLVGVSSTPPGTHIRLETMAPNLEPCLDEVPTIQLKPWKSRGECRTPERRAASYSTPPVSRMYAVTSCNIVRHTTLFPAFAHSIAAGGVAANGTVTQNDTSKHASKAFDKISDDQCTRPLVRSGPMGKQSARVHHAGCPATTNTVALLRGKAQITCARNRWLRQRCKHLGCMVCNQ